MRWHSWAFVHSCLSTTHGNSMSNGITQFYLPPDRGRHQRVKLSTKLCLVLLANVFIDQRPLHWLTKCAMCFVRRLKSYSLEFVIFLRKPNVQKSSVNQWLPLTSQYKCLPPFGRFKRQQLVAPFGELGWTFQVNKNPNLDPTPYAYLAPFWLSPRAGFVTRSSPQCWSNLPPKIILSPIITAPPIHFWVTLRALKIIIIIKINDITYRTWTKSWCGVIKAQLELKIHCFTCKRNYCTYADIAWCNKTDFTQSTSNLQQFPWNSVV